MVNADIQAFLAQGFSGITADSRQVTEAGLFVAYPGETQDGRRYIAQAVTQGAKGVLYEASEAAAFELDLQNEEAVAYLAIKGLKQQVGEIAAEYYSNPTKKCDVIGVTGTNGKTTVTQWLAQAYAHLEQNSAVIGTLGYGSLGSIKATGNTTPDAIVLQSMFAELVAEGSTLVAMEVSSHGLAQARVEGVVFDVAVFTNLSRDHLDYHKTMAEYGATKRQLFEKRGLNGAVINWDDDFGREMAADLMAKGERVLTYGFKSATHTAHVQGEIISLNNAGLHLKVAHNDKTFDVKANVIGQFNAENILAVVATLISQGVSKEQIVGAIGEITPVAGRMQQLGGESAPLVVIDYAHTPEALEKVLESLQGQCNETQAVWCVFGCGGDRDKGKRAQMGEIAEALADHVIVTSDNPRSESPMAIIEEIKQGLQGQYWIEEDRKKAILQAIQIAGAGDVVLVAGKGHENYQEIAGIKMPFSDEAVAQLGLTQFWPAGRVQ